jgi:outer membrane protein assembly factor BamB
VEFSQKILVLGAERSRMTTGQSWFRDEFNVRKTLPVTLSLALLGITALPAGAQPGATADALHEAAQRAAAGRWAEAIDQYQRILETAGDELTPVLQPVMPLALLAGGPVHTVAWRSDRSIPARWICHAQLSQLPPAALKQYRDRVDSSAAKLLEEARERPSDRALEKILADWFCSGPAEDAILLLALRALDRADFDAAERYWRMLLPDAAQPELRYPQPKTPPAAIQARLILLRLFRGEVEEAKAGLKAFRAAHSNASGLLAGRDGNYVETLEALLKNPERTAVAPLPQSSKAWPTFGGNPERNGNITSGLPRYWPGPPTWRSDLPGQVGKLGGDDRPGAPDHPRALSFHPVIAHGRIFVAAADRVVAYDLLTGERSTVFDLRKSMIVPGLDQRLPVRSDVRYTLTYANDSLIVRFGVQALQPRGGEADPNESSSAIVCLGPIAERLDKPSMRWMLKPPTAAKDATVIFEGTPIVHEDRLYVSIWRQSGGEATTSVACYQVFRDGEPPELLWQRPVGKAAVNPTAEPRTRHELLTLAGPNIVFCTHSGSIIALEARSGRPAWEYRYAHSQHRPQPVGRDLTPCLFDGARIFAAPADASRLLCFDAFSGMLLWEIEGVDVVHLLGVARGRLIATFAGAVKGIRGINVRSGAQTLPDGWTRHDDGGEATFGRGFVSPDLIFWPTRHGFQFLDPEDGRPTRQPVPGLFGNLFFADGCFVVTTATEVWGFVGDGRLLEPRKKELDKRPKDKPLIYKLGLSEADAGRFDEALAHFDELSADRNGELAANACERAAAIRWAMAEKQRTPDAARPICQEIVERCSNGGPFALLARLRLAELAEQDGQTAAAFDRWQTVNKAAQGMIIESNGDIRFVSTLARLALQRLGAGDRNPRQTIPAAEPVAEPFDFALPLRRSRQPPPRSQALDFAERFAWCPAKAEDPSELREPKGIFSGSLNAFHRHGNRLYTLYDSRALLAINLDSGDALWTHWATSSRSLRGDSAVTIRPFFHVGERYILIQLSSGRAGILDAKNGKILHELTTARRAWDADPAIIDAKTVAFPEDAEAIACLDLETGQRKWWHTIERPTSLVGNPAGLRYDFGTLFVGIERNQGTELDALNAADGRRLWPEPLSLGTRSLRMQWFGIDAKTVFVVAEERLLAIDRASGKLLRETTLPDFSRGDWRIVAGKNCLLVFPVQTQPIASRAASLELSWSFADVTLPARLARLYDAMMDRTFPVLLIDKTDGKLVQRFEFPAKGLTGDVRASKNGVVVNTGAGTWTLESANSTKVSGTQR